MLAQIREFQARMEAALQSQDLDQLRQTSLDCERFLRARLPLASGGEQPELAELVPALEALVQCYHQAVTRVDQAKRETLQQMSTLSRSRNSAHKYLDVAQQIAR